MSNPREVGRRAEFQLIEWQLDEFSGIVSIDELYWIVSSSSSTKNDLLRVRAELKFLSHEYE